MFTLVPNLVRKSCYGGWKSREAMYCIVAVVESDRSRISGLGLRCEILLEKAGGFS